MAEEETEEVETEETEEETTDDESDGWTRMRTMLGEVVDERLSQWSPGESSSSNNLKKETPKTPPRKKERKKGFLSDLFDGL